MRLKQAKVKLDNTYITWCFYGLPIFVTLTEDVMFVNGVPFLVTFSRKIQLFTFQFFPSRTSVQLSIHLTKVVKLYARSSFSIRTILMDQ